MESLKKILAQVAAQLQGMTLSQRLAIVLAAVLIAASVVWMAQWAAKPEMVALLGQDLQPEELATIRAGLEAMNEPVSVEGSRVYVSASANRPALLARLQQDNRMPADISSGFTALVQESNPWISQEENRRRWTVALQQELVRVLRTFDGVKQASVFLNLNSKRTLVARHEYHSTASVTLTMKDGTPVARSLAIAAARLVAGAVSGLSAEDVDVLDSRGRRAWNPEDDADGSASRLYREQLQRELKITEKILRHMPDPHARAEVTVKLNATSRQMTTESPTTPVEIETETTSMTSTIGQVSGEPGVRANTGTGAVANAGLREQTNQDTTKTRGTPGLETKIEKTPSGGVEEITAAIFLSDYYLSNIYARMNPDVEEGAEPTYEQLEQVFQQEQPRIRDQVRMLIWGQETRIDEHSIALHWYYRVPGDVPTAAASSLDGAADLAQRYGPQAGLGLLALMSLGIMLRMARRSKAGEAYAMELGLPKEAIEMARQSATEDKKAGSPRASGATGDAEDDDDETSPTFRKSRATDGVLVAEEVEESVVQMQKMMQQVADLTESDPSVVAGLMERWVENHD